MFYVYILKSIPTSRIYKGFTSDIKQRLVKHNGGQVKSTKPYLPWKLIYLEMFSNEIDARREEKFLKTGKGKERIKYLLRNTFN